MNLSPFSNQREAYKSFLSSLLGKLPCTDRLRGVARDLVLIALAALLAPATALALVCDGKPVQTFDPCERGLWPNGVIPYEIDATVSNSLRGSIRKAMDAWEQKTGNRIRFVANATSSPRVIVRAQSGCRSGIPGMGSGNTYVDFGACGDAIPHELGHVIGLSHEHQRFDRDRFVKMGFDPTARCDLWYDNGIRCAYASPGSDFGPYRVDSAMQYNSTPTYPFYDKATGQPVPSHHDVTDQDGSNAREMYGYAYGWKKFFPMARDVGSDRPLDPSIRAGVSIVGSPAITSQGGPKVLDTFVRGSDGRIYHRFHVPDGWSDYSDLGGVFDTDPAAAAFGARKVLVAAGRGGDVHSRRFVGDAWQGWASHGHPAETRACSAPSLASSGDRAYLSVRGCDDRIYVQTTVNAGGLWSTWQAVESAPQGVKLVGKPVAAAWSPTHVDLFVNSTNGHIWHKWYESSWKPGWEDLHCCAQQNSSPAVTARTPGRLDILYRGSDNGLWWYYYDGGQWHGGSALGGLLIADPAAVSGYADHIDVLGILRDGALWHRWYH